MPSRARFAPDLREQIEQRLMKILRGFVTSGVLPRCLIAFPGDVEMEFKLQLTTDPSWKIIHAGVDEGLVGQAFRNNKICTWKSGDQSSVFQMGDTRTRYEVAAGLRHDSETIAVLLVDYFEGEVVPKDLSSTIRGCRTEIETALGAMAREREEIARDIMQFTEGAVSDTRSVRGFTALVRWDGSIEYFVAGAGKERFKYLSQLEGLCGLVLRSGRSLNAANVWAYEAYRSSDDRVQSEAITPIMVGDEVVGVLNMESYERSNYTPEDMKALEDAASDLAELAQRYLSPGDAEIGMHSRMLSDLVERFSIETHRLIDMVGVDHVRHWALEECRSKVAKLRLVQSAIIAGPHPAQKKGKNYRKAADSFGNTHVNMLPDGRFTAEFEVLRDGAIIATLDISFEGRPDGSILDVIRQFCRITGNEIRRRTSELRSFEFERLIEHLSQCSAKELMNRVPACLKRMFECDDVTFFVADHCEEGQVNLVPWSSTALRLIPQSSEPFYRASTDDGFTGYASTIDDVMVIRNVADKHELENFDPEPHWEKKLSEGDKAPLRSYFAVPLRRSSRLVGLIRGHRHTGANNVPLSESDKERLRLVRFLLERIFTGADLEFGPPSVAAPIAETEAQQTTH